MTTTHESEPVGEHEPRDLHRALRRDCTEALREEIQRENARERATRRSLWEGGLLDANGLLLLAR